MGGGRGWGRLLFWGVLLVQNHWHYLTSCKCVPMSCKFTKRSVKGGKRIVSVVGGLSAANPTELEPGWGTGTLSTAGLWVHCAACPGSTGSSLVLAFSSASSWVRLSFCRLVSIALLWKGREKKKKSGLAFPFLGGGQAFVWSCCVGERPC